MQYFVDSTRRHFVPILFSVRHTNYLIDSGERARLWPRPVFAIRNEFAWPRSTYSCSCVGKRKRGKEKLNTLALCNVSPGRPRNGPRIFQRKWWLRLAGCCLRRKTDSGGGCASLEAVVPPPWTARGGRAGAGSRGARGGGGRGGDR